MILTESWSDFNRIRKQTITSKDIYVFISSGQFMLVAVNSTCAEVKHGKSWFQFKAFSYDVNVGGHVGVPISSILSCEETPSPQSA